MANRHYSSGYRNPTIGRVQPESIQTIEKGVIRAMQEDEMGHIHITENRVNIPIYKMTDSHLINTIKMISKNMSQEINMRGDFTAPSSMMDIIMEGKSQVKANAEDIKGLVSNTYHMLGRYCFEGVRRGKIMEVVGALGDITLAFDTLLCTTPDGKSLPSPIKRDKGGKEETDG